MATTSKGSSKDQPPRHARNRSRSGVRGGAATSTRPVRTAAAAGTKKTGGPPKARARSDGSDRGFVRRNWWMFALAPVALALLGFLVLFIAYLRIDLPKALPPVQTTFVYDRDDRLLSTIHGSVDRTLIRLEEMPEHTREAVIAVEDARFYEHSGVDLKGTIRAAWTDIVEGGAVQGGSTITQQLVKRIYAGHYTEPGENGIREYVIPPRTVKEKVREVLLAMKAERTLSKDQILAKYLNTVYFGHGAYGIEAAARTYFDIPAERLSVLQSATLAGILTAPEAYDPIDHPFDAKFRRDFALARMVRYGYLEAAEAERLSKKPCCGIPLAALQGRDTRIDAPGNSEYFVQYVKESLTERYGSAEVFGGGLKVTTTLDLDLQTAAEEEIAEHLPSPGDPEAALVAIDPRNGGILAMAGGRDFSTSQLNLATFKGGTGRQAGSAFKAFTLAEAMDQKISLNSYWYGPNEITIDDPMCADQTGELWTPENAEGGGGTYTLRSATANSVNTVYAQLVVELGPRNVTNMARRLGIGSKLPPVCSVTLGSVAVNPLEMTNAYATLAAGGERRWATPLLQVRSPGGRIDDPDLAPEPEPVIGRNVAALVSDTLQDVLVYGTGASARLSGYEAAGKTGTAQDNVDAWFCGYTMEVAACVWVGYPKGQIPLVNIEGVPEVFGGTIPAAIWHDFMEVAMAEIQDPAPFPEPNFEGLTDTPSAAAPPPPPPSPSAEPTAEPTPTPSEEPPEEPSPEPSAEPPSVTPSPPSRPEDRGG